MKFVCVLTFLAAISQCCVAIDNAAAAAAAAAVDEASGDSPQPQLQPRQQRRRRQLRQRRTLQEQEPERVVDPSSTTAQAVTSDADSSTAAEGAPATDAAVSATSDGEGNVEALIIGGSVVANTNKKYPWFVHTGACGATLVAKDVVMSAAHCYNAIKSRVLVGAVKENQPSVGDAEWRNVLSATKIKHPKYNARTNAYDIMLFKIQEVTKPHLVPVKLNGNDSVPSVGSQLEVIGIGATNAAGTQYGPDLRYVNVKSFSQNYCKDRYGSGIIENAMLCAGVTKGRKDSCYGDSGGPLINQAGTQVGIVSFGAGCADPNFPGVYSRVSGSIDWIKKTICDLSDTNPEMCRTGNASGGGSSGNNNEVDEGETVSSGSNSNSNNNSGRVISYTATIQYDLLPNKVSAYIADDITGEKVVEFPRGSVTQANVKRTKGVPLVAGRTYDLVMEAGRVFCCNNGKSGFVNIVAKRKDGYQMWNKMVPQRFKQKDIVTFTVPLSLA